PEEPLEHFFEIFRPMQKKMGPVLIQLPHMVKFSFDKTEHLFKLLKKSYKKYSFVLEPRHETWFKDEPLALLTKYNIGLVISQSGVSFPYSEKITAKNIYVRFHGPAELYASSYSDEMLMEFAGKFRGWVAAGHVIWSFFNNDVHGHAFRNAQRLKEILKA
ncbi:MAG TPA: DUF72 domain-containing protein, partial [Chitinophagaceae bacterium]|nr:DUF72 domain-containing protein [Chitinophagaceae bacterium]